MWDPSFIGLTAFGVSVMFVVIVDYWGVRVGGGGCGVQLCLMLFFCGPQIIQSQLFKNQINLDYYII